MELSFTLVLILLCITTWFIFCIIGDSYMLEIAFDLAVKPECDNKTCIDLTTFEINNVKFKVIINWLLFVITLFVFYLCLKDFKNNDILPSLIKTVFMITILVFMLMGGIFTSDFAFNSIITKCTPGYTMNCYDLNDSKLTFMQGYSVLSILLTFIFTTYCTYQLAIRT